MSEATRAIALQEAVKFSPLNSGHALVIAEQFNAFLEGTPVAPVVAAKPAAPKFVKLAKPAKSEEEVVQEFVAKAAAKAAAEDAAEVAAVEGTATPERVEAVIGDMLKANKRKEAIGLLASFNGAKSKTGIIEQGADVMAAFVEQAEAILLGS